MNNEKHKEQKSKKRRIKCLFFRVQLKTAITLCIYTFVDTLLLFVMVWAYVVIPNIDKLFNAVLTRLNSSVEEKRNI